MFHLHCVSFHKWQRPFQALLSPGLSHQNPGFESCLRVWGLSQSELRRDCELSSTRQNLISVWGGVRLCDEYVVNYETAHMRAEVLARNAMLLQLPNAPKLWWNPRNVAALCAFWLWSVTSASVLVPLWEFGAKFVKISTWGFCFLLIWS